MGGVIQVMMQANLDVYARLCSTSVLLLLREGTARSGEAELLRLQAQRLQDALQNARHPTAGASRISRLPRRLTGTFNRNGLLRELQSVGQSRATGVISLDLDDFQQINRLIGVERRPLSRNSPRTHAAGLGVDGALARIAGDEFLVLVRRPTGWGHHTHHPAANRRAPAGI